MHNVEIRPGVAMAFEDHCFAPPWTSPQTIVMVHGNAESSRAWTGFVPHLAGAYRVVRPDMPGFGASAEPPGYRWQVDELASDLGRFLDALNIAKCHLIGAKYGGSVVMQYAIGHSDRLHSLSPVRLAGARQRQRQRRQDSRSRRARLGASDAAGAARCGRVGSADRLVDG